MTATGIGANHSGADSTLDRPDELESSRKERVSADARDGDDAVLERLAQRFEHGARELRELVQQQYTAVLPERAGMSLERLARPGPSARVRDG